MNWRIIVAREAEKTLRRLGKTERLRLCDAINRLIEEPRPGTGRDIAGIQGVSGLYRLRIGRTWRVLFTLNEEEHTVYVIAVRPRGQAYRP
ncbi:MAG: type II toxin-antitoxin system RelE/ParE family toxin [Firmicutes bacterium]|nr:type II toxin-antitoxin system RelE/ParE family toxin [Bacillota bacterium]